MIVIGGIVKADKWILTYGHTQMAGLIYMFMYTYSKGRLKSIKYVIDKHINTPKD